MKKAGIAALVIGILLIVGSLYVARTVQNSAVISQIAKVLNLEVNRENAGKLQDAIGSLTNDGLTDAEKVARVGQSLGVEYSDRDAKVIIGRAKKLLANGMDNSSKICLTLHPMDQWLNIVGLVGVLGGGALVVLGGKKKVA